MESVCLAIEKYIVKKPTFILIWLFSAKENEGLK